MSMLLYNVFNTPALVLTRQAPYYTIFGNDIVTKWSPLHDHPCASNFLVRPENMMGK